MGEGDRDALALRTTSLRSFVRAYFSQSKTRVTASAMGHARAKETSGNLSLFAQSLGVRSEQEQQARRARKHGEEGYFWRCLALDRCQQRRGTATHAETR